MRKAKLTSAPWCRRTSCSNAAASPAAARAASSSSAGTPPLWSLPAGLPDRPLAEPARQRLAGVDRARGRQLDEAKAVGRGGRGVDAERRPLGREALARQLQTPARVAAVEVVQPLDRGHGAQ